MIKVIYEDIVYFVGRIQPHGAKTTLTLFPLSEKDRKGNMGGEINITVSSEGIVSHKALQSAQAKQRVKELEERLK